MLGVAVGEVVAVAGVLDYEMLEYCDRETIFLEFFETETGKGYWSAR